MRNIVLNDKDTQFVVIFYLCTLSIQTLVHSKAMLLGAISMSGVKSLDSEIVFRVRYLFLV